MRNSIVFVFVVLVASAAMFGIFHLIFPYASVLMGWCVASGILMVIALAANILIVSSQKSLSVKNAAVSWCINVAAVSLFAWTLLFAFLLGDYQTEERSLNGLYIGYLIILVVGLGIFFLADRGGSIAQSHNAAIQAAIIDRESYIAQLKQLKLNAETAVALNTDEEINRMISKNIDLLRNVPSSRFNSQAICNQLSEALMNLDMAIECQDSDKLKMYNHKLSSILKSIRI